MDIVPYRETRLPAPLRLPRWLQVLLGAAAAAGPVRALTSRRPRALRGLLASSAMAYFVVAAVDLAEHFHLEKRATGHFLRWTVVPPSESLVHGAIMATNLSALVLARPLRQPLGVRDAWLLAAPAVYFTLGWIDELVYHRRRAPRREHIIHTTEHIAEGVMWTLLYAARLRQW